ncbi:MAG TPA: CoA transferase [Vicinamibacterales bacterium]|jgi:crotonobetainyl-CoA:carnitine CoA-transferase CaiB-like acyl-CoA transferase|nr:CoA transferase [Vicinamibacterales bacterium]
MAPLDGITVLDLTRVLSGPYCTMLLADMGARVIKVEQPGTGDDTRGWGPPFLYPNAQSPRAGEPGEKGESAYFLSINRNKESITLDFKHPDGRALLEQLVGKADVLVENFRPGTLTRLGLDYDTLSKKHPRLIYCSISGFGHTGPRWKQPGYDAIMQAEGGLMSITGTADGPPVRLGVAIVDIISGMFAAYGVAMALLSRERSGRGQEVDLAMLDATVALLTYQAGNYFASGKVPARLGNRHPSIVPYETFTASDGDFVLAVGNDDQWRRFCAVAELPEDERFATNRQRVSGYEALRPLVADRLRQQPRQHWIEALTGAGVPCGSVRNFEELFADPQLAAREMIATVEHATIGSLKALGVPVKLSETPGAVRMPPPTLGQHTDTVLRHDLGFSADAIAALRRQQVI